MNDQTQQRQEPRHPMVQFKHDLDAMVSKELDMLDEKARHRMRNAAIVAVTKDADLLIADRASFMMALRMCASHGVIPDGNEATLQTYNTKVKINGKDEWIKKVTYLPMIRGIVNRVERSGKIKPFYAEVVYEGETFTIDISNGDRRPSHVYDPMRRGDDAMIVGAYSVARYSDGIVDCEVMPRADIEKVKAVAKTKNVWDGWYAEKAKVAVMKRHAKRLPLSAEDMEFILNREETDFDQTPRDVTPKAKTGFAQMAEEARAKAIEKQEDETPLPDLTRATEAELVHVQEEQQQTAKDATQEVSPPEGSPAYRAGWIMGKDPEILRGACPHGDDIEKATDWLAGFDDARGGDE